MLTVLAFLLALGLLIAIHEWGHYRAALACGIRVLRFSIGFGKPLWSWRSKTHGTEFTLSALPLGGYVRMLDEREGPVDPAERHLAFNTQPLRSRAFVVAAGPLANLLLAVALYAVVSWVGVEQARPVLASPTPGSMAERAGLQAGQWVLQVSEAGEEPQDVATFEELRWTLVQAALTQTNVTLWVAPSESALPQPVQLPLANTPADIEESELTGVIGLAAPWSAPIVGSVLGDGAAAAAGLQAGDTVRSVDGRRVEDAQQLRQWIKTAVNAQGQGVSQRWVVDRAGRAVELSVTPKPVAQGDQLIGRVGASIGAPPASFLVREDFMGGWWQGLRKTWEVSVLSLRMMGKMLVGEASIKNLSGPLTIADYAGKSASLGWVPYLTFLALISVSLGVLNLLPLPVLDGGHLMYYLWEWLTGKPVPDPWMERLQRGGVALMALLMSVAVFNDIARLWG